MTFPATLWSSCLLLLIWPCATFAEENNPAADWNTVLPQPGMFSLAALADDDFAGEEEIVPRIPEPLVFELIRPLGERKGSQAIDVLSLIPLGPTSKKVLEYIDPLGIPQYGTVRREIFWAPEYEIAIADGLAIEFELPFAGDTLDAYRFAGQYTIGTAFNNSYIHGLQTIIEPDTDLRNWNLSLLYCGGYRVDETWSLLGMIGGRTVTRPGVDDDRTDLLLNLNIFADITPRLTTGVESNFVASDEGNCSLLLTPQVHCELTKRIMLQTGFGAAWDDGDFSTLLALRSIYLF
ncbi:hypothetical protein [Planctomicrobium sp. SH664]|uniref:hypothetical protein n=1 Tax=Planctomicrobium sp. SH664 TaxID=3448125 RepID=UPI003F5B823C